MSWKNLTRRKELDHKRYMLHQAERKAKDKEYYKANRDIIRYKRRMRYKYECGIINKEEYDRLIQQRPSLHRTEEGQQRPIRNG